VWVARVETKGVVLPEKNLGVSGGERKSCKKSLSTWGGAKVWGCAEFEPYYGEEGKGGSPPPSRQLPGSQGGRTSDKKSKGVVKSKK